MKIVYCDAHSVLTYDEMRLFHSLGHEVFNVGGYIHPSRPQEAVRPPLPQIPEYPALIASVDALGQPHAQAPHGGDCSQGHLDTLDAAKTWLPDEVLQWADVVMFAAKEHTWLIPQWDRIREKRVIWRTIGQSTHGNEWAMAPIHRQGCEIVRYSPKERNIPEYAGEDALIRFGKDPDEWTGWTGEEAVVTNFTQSLYQRSLYDGVHLAPSGNQWTNWLFWEQSTFGLPRKPAGNGSEVIDGVGSLPFEDMKALLRSARCYLYTGTQPASYTLGFIEAMMTGIPVVSIGPKWMGIFPYSPDMFEGHEIAPLAADRPDQAKAYLRRLLNEPETAAETSRLTRQIALELFDSNKIARQWSEYLVPARELVAA